MLIRNGRSRGQTREIFNKVHDTSKLPWRKQRQREKQRERNGTGRAIVLDVHVGSEVSQLEKRGREKGPDGEYVENSAVNEPFAL